MDPNNCFPSTSPSETPPKVEMFGSKTNIPVKILQADLSSSETSNTTEPKQSALPSILYSLTLTVQQEETQKPISSKLRIPLANEATVTSFSFLKDEMWYPAVPVSKKKAKEVVYKEREKGRDVAAVSNVASTNVFEIEVFPLEFKMEKKCKLEFIVPRVLSQGLVGDALLQALGFSFDDGTKVTVMHDSSGMNTTETDSITHTLDDKSRKVWVGTAYGERHFVCEVNYGAIKNAFDQAMTIEEKASLQGTTDTNSNTDEDETKHIGIIWDTSASQATVDVQDRCNKLRALSEQAGSKCSFYLWNFDIHGVHHVNGGMAYDDIDALIRDIHSFQYDGGTDMTLIPKFLGSDGLDTTMDAILIFSDGVDSFNQLPSFSDIDVAKCHSLPHIYCVGDQPTVNMNILRKLANANPNLPGRIFGKADEFYDMDVFDSGTEKYCLERIIATDQSEEAFFGMEEDGFICIPDHHLMSRSALDDYQLRKEDDCIQLSGRIGDTVTGLSLQFNLRGSNRSCTFEILFEADNEGNSNTSFVDFDLTGTDESKRLLGMIHAIAVYNETEKSAGKMDLSKADVAIMLADLATKYNFCTPEASLLLLYTAEQFEDNDIACPEFHPAYAEWSSREAASKKAEVLAEQKRIRIGEQRNSEPSDVGQRKKKAHVGDRKTVQSIEKMSVYVTNIERNHKDPEPIQVKSNEIRGGRGGRGGMRVRSLVRMRRRLTCPAPEENVRCERENNDIMVARLCSGRRPEEEEEEIDMGGGMDMFDGDVGCSNESDEDSSNINTEIRSMSSRQSPKKRKPKKSQGATEIEEGPTLSLPSDPKEYEAIITNALSTTDDFDSILAKYLELRQNEELNTSPSFFLNVGRLLLSHGDSSEEDKDGNKAEKFRRMALKAASNCLEMNVGDDAQMLRCVGYFLLSSQEFEKAIVVFDEVSELAPLEPQSFLDCALSRIMMVVKQIRSNMEVDACLIEQAQTMVVHVLLHEWVTRFAEIEYPALMLLHWMERFIALYNQRKVDGASSVKQLPSIWDRIENVVNVFASEAEATTATEHRDDLTNLIKDVAIAKELLKLRFKDFGLGLMVWMSWDTDRTDIDLHVHENVTGGEHVYYQNRHSRTGGYISRDFTQGYGPEVYSVKRPLPGSYKIEAKYYGSHQASKLTGATSAVLWLLKDTNVAKEAKNADDIPDDISLEFKTVRLEAAKEMHHVHTLEFTK